MSTQRGNGFGLYIVYLFFYFFGYIGLRFILVFVVFYFSLTTPLLKRYLREYYLLATGKFNYKIYYKHLYTFSLIFSDRFLSKRFSQRYHIHPQNKKSYIADETKGVLFLFSHIGDWTTCELLPSEKNISINIVMQEAIKESIQKFGNSIKKEKEGSLRIIDLSEGGISVAIKVAKAFQNGEIVAMMSDRILSAQGAIKVNFLGKEIRINKNPFEVAYNRNVPLIALFSMRQRDYHYNAYYYWITPYNRDIPKEEAIAIAAQEYSELLEKMVREYPDQWFNHYDFFGTAA